MILAPRDGKTGQPKFLTEEPMLQPTDKPPEPLAALRRALWMMGWPRTAIDARIREVQVIQESQRAEASRGR